MPCKIVFSAGAKGGTGKSTALRYLISWYEENGIQPHLIDADDESATLKRYHPRAVTIEPRRRKAYDLIIDVAVKEAHPLIVVDLKAGVGFDLMHWFGDLPFEELDALGVRLLCVGVVTSSPDSVSSFLRWADFLGKNVQYCVFKNLKDSDAGDAEPQTVVLPEWDETKQALEFRKLFKPYEIVLPQLDPEYQAEMERLNLTISDVLGGEHMLPPVLDRIQVKGRLRRYQNRLFDCFLRQRKLFLP